MGRADDKRGRKERERERERAALAADQTEKVSPIVKKAGATSKIEDRSSRSIYRTGRRGNPRFVLSRVRRRSLFSLAVCVCVCFLLLVAGGRPSRLASCWYCSRAELFSRQRQKSRCCAATTVTPPPSSSPLFASSYVTGQVVRLPAQVRIAGPLAPVQGRKGPPQVRHRGVQAYPRRPGRLPPRHRECPTPLLPPCRESSICRRPLSASFWFLIFLSKDDNQANDGNLPTLARYGTPRAQLSAVFHRFNVVYMGSLLDVHSGFEPFVGCRSLFLT